MRGVRFPAGVIECSVATDTADVALAAITAHLAVKLLVDGYRRHYGSDDACRMVDEFGGELGITLVPFPEMVMPSARPEASMVRSLSISSSPVVRVMVSIPAWMRTGRPTHRK